MRQGVDHRQRLLFAEDVARSGFAGRRLIAPDAEDVILELKRPTQGRAVTPVQPANVFRRVGDQRADLRGHRQQRAGFACDHTEVVLRGNVQPPLERHVQELTLGQGNTHLVEAAQRGQHRRRRHTLRS